MCQNHDSSRRGFLKDVSMAGLGMAGIPQIASAHGTDPADEKSWSRSRALQNGKAQRITLLHTADIHAQLYTHDEFFWENNQAVYRKLGGFAVLKTMLKSLKATNPSNTLIIDGGDCFQGSGVASLSEGRAIVPLINNIGYDLVLPGNWEEVYGKEMLMKDMGGYQAQKICANMFHEEEEKKGDLMFPPYWTTHFGDVKIGFIGYNDPLTPRRQSPAYSKGIKFTQPEINSAKYIKYLRDYEKCSMVFLVTHMGIAQQVDLGNNPAVDGVDFILGADTHERVRKPIDTKYTKVTEPGAFGSFVAKLDVIIEDGKLKETQYKLLEVDPEKYKPDPEMTQLVKQAKAPYAAELDKVIGSTKTTLVRYFVLENPMDNLITDAIMWKFNPDIALSNGFRFCPPLHVAPGKEKVDITNEFLWNMLPVDSDAKEGYITGEKLWQWMEKELHNVFAKKASERFGGWVVRFSGMEVNLTAKNEKGKRINWIKVKGEPVDLKKSYRIVACEREGDPEDMICRIENVSQPKLLGTTLHPILREYLAKHSPVSPKVVGKVTATDQPATLLTQLEGYDYQFS
ncbi:MAG: bifunctional metallophosphatase/5'-nucleotidase [Sphingobacteriales bacterium]|nr:MAG: bifunctional metallophosphatase/5'-nucleotidase [Sphingobacteriales bacterium]